MSASKGTAKKQTQSTEVILGTAATKLTRGLEELKNVGSVLGELASKAETLTAEIAQKEERTAALDVEFAEKKRQAEVSLKLEMQANSEQAVTTILNSQNKIAIDQTEYQGTLNALKNLRADFDKDVQTKVGQAVDQAKKEWESEKKLMEATANAQEAQIKAELSQKEDQIEFLQSQIQDWKDALKAEREAGVERSKAGAVGTINVSGAGGK